MTVGSKTIWRASFALYTLMIPVFGIWRSGHLYWLGGKGNIQSDIGQTRSIECKVSEMGSMRGKCNYFAAFIP